MAKSTDSDFILFQKYNYEIKYFQKILRSIRRKNFFLSFISRFQKIEISPPVALIYGDAGVGKVEMGKYLYNKAIEAKLNGIQIDWRDEYQKYPEFFHRENYNVENFLNILYTAFRDAGYGKNFRDYEKICKLINDAENKVTEAIAALTIEQEAPDAFHKLRQFTAQTVRTLVGISSLGPAYSMIPDTLKEVADDAISETIKATAVGLAKTRLNRKEYDAYLNGTERLTHTLAKGIAKTSQKNPIVIKFNHYELILQADPWVRYLIKQTGSSILWIVVSHSAHSLVENYREDIQLDHRLIDIKMSCLSIVDVEEIINQYYSKKRNATPGEIRKVFEATGGNPLALRMAMELWFPGNSTGVEVLNVSHQRSKVFDAIFEQYMFNKLVSPADQSPLYILAFCFAPNQDLLKALLDLPDIRLIISNLANKYSYLFSSDSELIQTVKILLREERLQNFSEKNFQNIAKRATEWWNARMLEIEDQYNNDLAKCVNQDAWRYNATATVYHCFWWKDNQANDIFTNILQAILFLPREKMLGFIWNIWKVIGPLADVQPVLRDTLVSFQRGIAGLFSYRDFPADTTEIHFDGWELKNEHGEVVTDIKPFTTQRALEILDNLEEKAADSMPRFVAVQMAKAHFQSHLRNIEEAYVLLDLAKKSISPAMKETSIILGVSYRNLGQSILNTSSPARLAVECFLSAIELIGEDALLLNELARAYFQEMRYEKVIEATDAAIALNPTLGVGYARKGGALSRLNRHEEAIEIYSEGLKYEKGTFARAILFTNLGISYANLGRLDEAEVQYENALKIEPNLSFTRLCKSILILEKYPDLALSELRKSIQLLQFIDDAYIDNVTKILAHADNLTAIEILEKILSQSRRMVVSPYVLSAFHYQLGKCYIFENKWAEAANHFEKSIEIMPRFTPSYLELATIYHTLKKFERSRDVLFRAVQLMNFSGLNEFVTNMIANVGQSMTSRQIERQMKKVQKSQKRGFEQYLRQGAAELLLNNYSKAVQSLRLATKINRDQFWTYYLLCVLEWKQGNISGALKQAENIIIRLNKGSRGFAYYMRAKLLEEQGAIEEAIEAFERSLDDYALDRPVNQVVRSSVLFDLGLCLFKNEKHEEAMDAFNKVYIYDPISPAGYLSHIIILINQEDWGEARLEMRRLEKLINWEEKLDSKEKKWKSPHMADLYNDFVVFQLIVPILQAALLLGDKETVSRIYDGVGRNSMELVDINHPIYKLAPEAWDVTLPHIFTDNVTNNSILEDDMEQLSVNNGD